MSVLGKVFLNLFTSDLKLGAKYEVVRFADGSMIFRMVVVGGTRVFLNWLNGKQYVRLILCNKMNLAILASYIVEEV